MIPHWTPETWGDFSVVGIVIVIAAILYWSLVTERIVIGRYHRDVVDRLEKRAEKDAEAINTLSTALAEKNATEDATTRILAALRETITSGER